MYTPSYFYRSVRKKNFFDEIPYSFLGSKAMPFRETSRSIKLGSENYAWSAGNFCFRPKNGDKDKLGRSGIMAQLIYYGKLSNQFMNTK